MIHQTYVIELAMRDTQAENRTIPLLTLDELTAMGKRQVAARKAAVKRQVKRERKSRKK